jgi:hypothetical protein
LTTVPEPSPGDLLAATSAARRALAPFVDEDWTIGAGELDWSVRTTLAHVSDALGWYAAHLAAASPSRLRLDVRVPDDASNAEVLDVLGATTAVLAHVAHAAAPGARGYHPAGMADVAGFLAMGCDEVLVHCWDAVRGLGSDFTAPDRLAERVLCRLFPWVSDRVPPWRTLLWANGRIALPGRARLRPDWQWHCAPVSEWDGTVPRRNGSPPTRFRWDEGARRWRPAR